MPVESLGSDGINQCGSVRNNVGARHNAGCIGLEHTGIIQDRTVDNRTVEDSTVDDRTIEDSTVEDSTVEDRTIEGSRVTHYQGIEYRTVK